MFMVNVRFFSSSPDMITVLCFNQMKTQYSTFNSTLNKYKFNTFIPFSCCNSTYFIVRYKKNDEICFKKFIIDRENYKNKKHHYYDLDYDGINCNDDLLIYKFLNNPYILKEGWEIFCLGNNQKYHYFNNKIDVISEYNENFLKLV